MPGKVCEYCHQDCSDKPRVKDPSGAYFCKECYPAAQAAMKNAAKGQSGALVSGVFDEPIVPTADMLAPKDEPKQAKAQAEEAEKNAPPKSCSSCGILMPSSAVVCTNCGFNTKSGKGLKTKIEKAKVIKEKKSGGGGGIDLETLIAIVASVAVLVGAVGLGAGMGMEDKTMKMVGVFGIAGATLIVYFGCMLVALVRDGILWAIGIFFVLPALWWAFDKCQNTWLKMMFIAVVLLGVIGRVVNLGDVVGDALDDKKSMVPAPIVQPSLPPVR